VGREITEREIKGENYFALVRALTGEQVFISDQECCTDNGTARLPLCLCLCVCVCVCVFVCLCLSLFESNAHFDTRLFLQ